MSRVNKVELTVYLIDGEVYLNGERVPVDKKEQEVVNYIHDYLFFKGLIGE